jgi:hypothetical protein
LAKKKESKSEIVKLTKKDFEKIRSHPKLFNNVPSDYKHDPELYWVMLEFLFDSGISLTKVQ